VLPLAARRPTRRWRALGVGAAVVALLVAPAIASDPGTPPPASFDGFTIGSWDGPDAAGWYVSGDLPADDAVLVGASWDGHARVELRALPRGGEWGRWMPFAAAHDHAPDEGPAHGHDHGGHDDADHTNGHEHEHARGHGHSVAHGYGHSDGREYHDPLWIGPTERFQVRVQAEQPPTVELETIGMPAAEMVAYEPPVPGAGAAIASGAPPEIIPRSAWDPDGECRPREDVDPGDGVDMAHVHHTVMFPNYSPEEADDVVRALCLFHVEAREFKDLGYHFLIDKYGRIYEGRAGSLDRSVEGGHAAGFNSVSVGVSLMGDFESDPVPDEALDALERFLAWLFLVHDVDPNGVVAVESTGGITEGLTRFEEGESVELPTIVGHQDTGSNTLCPGRYLTAAMDGIHERVDTRMIAATEDGIAPVIAPEPQVGDEDDGDRSLGAAALEDAPADGEGPDDENPTPAIASDTDLATGGAATVNGSALALAAMTIAVVAFEVRRGPPATSAGSLRPRRSRRARPQRPRRSG
jgi:hypothetical protein